MRFRAFLAGLALMGLWLSILSAATPRMPVGDVRPGMVGIGRTVFEGDKIEEFKVHIIGVLRNVMGPSRNLILARLEGGPLAQTGVIAGMSGSPVYIDGRLVGAVSYSLGNFSREPMAGITPIDEMIEATENGAPRAVSVRAQLDLPITPATLAATLQSAFAAVRPFAASPADVQVISADAGSTIDPQVGPMLRPIATPIVLGGFRGDVADLVSSAFRASNFLPTTGGAPHAGEDTPAAAEASSLAMPLVSA